MVGEFSLLLQLIQAEHKLLLVVGGKWEENEHRTGNIDWNGQEKGIIKYQQHLCEHYNNVPVNGYVKMKKFNHHNVLKMIGISVYEGKPCIILPLMSNGDLQKYLKSNKSVSIF